MQRVASATEVIERTGFQKSPFFCGDKTILDVEPSSVAILRGFVLRMSSMFGLVIAFIALFSASIFLAHAVEAYHAQ
jgi:hypothetical protein